MNPRNITYDDFEAFLKRASSIRQECFWTSFKQEFPGYLFRLIRLGLWKIFRKKPLPKGLSVAFIGIDGAGKSTIIQRIALDLKWPFVSKIVYMGDNQYLLRPAWFVHKLKNKTNKKVFWLSSAYLILGVLDKWLRVFIANCHRAKGGIVLYDRWFHDLLTNPQIKENSWKFKVKKFLYRISPKADIVIFLDVNAEEGHGRKAEWSVHELAKIRENYLCIREKYDSRIIPVNNSGQSAEATVQNCIGIIWQRLLKK